MAIWGTALTTLLITWSADGAATVALLTGYTAASTVTLALISLAAVTGRRGRKPSAVLAIAARLVQTHIVVTVGAAAAAIYSAEFLLLCCNCGGFAAYAWLQVREVRDAITRYHHAATGIP